MPSTTYDTTAAMSVRDIADRTDAAGTAVLDYTGEEDRFVHTILSEGIIRPGNGWDVNPQGGTMTVLVGSGTARVDYAAVEGNVAGQGTYIVRLDETQVALTLGGSDGANSRVDQVYLVVRDDPYDATARGLPQLAVRQGDVGGGPPGPDGTWQAYLLLATITVGAGVTEITAAAIADERVQSTFLHGIPAGAIQMTAGTDTPPGWLLCDGQAVSRTTYARLFDAIGTAYGAGDGSTTFNVPNFAGRFAIGVGTLGADTYARGATGGSARHTLSTAELPAHDHGSTGSHGHAASSGAQSASHTHSGTTGSDSHSHTAQSNGSHTHPIDTDTGSSAMDHSQPYNHAGGTERNQTGNTDPGGSHTHTTTSDSHSHSFSTGGQSTGHTHAITVDAAGTHTHASVGSGAAHENRPPYVGVRFIIKT